MASLDNFFKHSLVHYNKTHHHHFRYEFQRIEPWNHAWIVPTSLVKRICFKKGMFVPWVYTSHISVYCPSQNAQNCRTRPYPIAYVYLYELCGVNPLGCVQRNSVVTLNGTTETYRKAKIVFTNTVLKNELNMNFRETMDFCFFERIKHFFIESRC